MEFSNNDYGYQAELHDSVGFKRSAVGDLSIGSLIGDAWSLTRDNLLETVGGMLLVFGITYGVQMVMTIGIYIALLGGMLAFGGLAEVIGPEAAGILAMVAGGFGYMLLIAVMMAIQALAFGVYQMLWLKVIRGQDQKINYVAALKSIMLPLMLSSVIVFGATMAGMLAFVIGAYVVALGLIMTTYLIVDHQASAMEAAKGSWKLMDGHKLQMFVLALALGGVNLVGMLACGIGMMVTVPLSIGTIALFYNRIARAGNAYLNH